MAADFSDFDPHKKAFRAWRKKLGILTMNPNFNFVTLKELIETGKVHPVIDRIYPLNETGKALAYYGKRHARGKVVISI